MSVTEADVMTLMGETQESTVGGRQADISAAIERQHAYEAGERAEFGTGANLGPQFLAQAVPFVTGAAFGSITSFGIGAPSPVRLSQVDPQVNFPPRFPGGEPMQLPRQPPITNFPVPYEPPGSGGMWAAGGIGAVLAGVIGALWEGWPNALDPEIGPYDTRAPAGAPNVETPQEGPELGPPNPQQIPGDYVDNPPVPGIPRFPGDTGSANPEDISAGPIPDSAYGPPQGSRQPAPTPAPTRHMPPWVWPAIGALGAIQLGRAGRSRSSMTLPANPVTVGLDLSALEPLLSSLTSTSSAATPLPQPYFLGQGAGDEGCNCGPKKQGKKRKCLARAQLTWRSGPKKGKAAGSRCYRFAD